MDSAGHSVINPDRATGNNIHVGLQTAAKPITWLTTQTTLQVNRPYTRA